MKIIYSIIGVRSCYDEGKRTAETLTMDYHRGANLEVYAVQVICDGQHSGYFLLLEIMLIYDIVLYLGEDCSDF